MTIRVKDFRMFAGDDKTLEVDVKDKDGNAVAITGATIAWTAARALYETAAISKTTVLGITITDGAGGIFQVSLDAADTDDLKGDYYHEAQVTFAGGDVATVLRGKMTVEPTLIRA